MDEKIKEIKNFWSYNGESCEVDDIVSIREMACSDVDELIRIIKDQQEELAAWRNEGMI